MFGWRAPASLWLTVAKTSMPSSIRAMLLLKREVWLRACSCCCSRRQAHALAVQREPHPVSALRGGDLCLPAPARAAPVVSAAPAYSSGRKKKARKPKTARGGTTLHLREWQRQMCYAREAPRGQRPHTRQRRGPVPSSALHTM